MRTDLGLIISLNGLMLLSFPAKGEGVYTLTNEWSVSLGTGTCESTPALGPDGTIYFGAWPDKLWALNADGTRKWIFRAQS